MAEQPDVDVVINNPPIYNQMPNASYTPGMYSQGGAFGMNNGMLEGMLFSMLAGNRNGFGNNNNGSGENLAKDIAASTASITAATQAQALAEIETTNRGSSENLRQFAQMAGDINRINGNIRLATSESESRIGSAIERNGGETRLTASQTESRLGSAVERTASITQLEIGNQSRELHGTIEARTAELRNTLAQNNAVTLLEIERNKFETIKAKCDLEKQAVDNLGAIQLEAAKNKFDVVTKMEECCCELKERIHKEGEETRELVTKNLIDQLRAEQIELKNALAEAREGRRHSEDRRNEDHITRITNILSANAASGRSS